ncbi:hypothetical protein E2C01_074254 [Portunus trituberculatus]|uniref:Uncharacterized protein n=1 Tax=Portunus trituberculatus TaxID=210409 RepID=A0A5B7IBP1_PORTR|nr:hypothetical protein [Portunus trituberculatus]
MNTKEGPATISTTEPKETHSHDNQVKRHLPYPPPCAPLQQETAPITTLAPFTACHRSQVNKSTSQQVKSDSTSS